MSFYSIAPFIQEVYPEYYSIETYPGLECVAIRKVKDPWGIMGNFAQTPILINDVTFKTSELLFQLMKFKDEEPVKAVYNANNPKMTAKHWEKTHRREDWGKIIVDTQGDGRLKETIFSLFGKDITKGLLETNYIYDIK